ncbi:hypothetical protein ABI59_18510 [Acidobacteria bacterium Mor1]|nr:hypothetical protein ABI59_18510 [Acidobacteria bacterium Mor1]
MTPRLQGRLLALAGGAWFGLCWNPFFLAPTIPLAAFLFMRALRGAGTGREALWIGLCFGAAKYIVGSHFLLWLTAWSVPLGIVIYLLAIGYILPQSMFECWTARWLEERAGLPRSLGLALVFTGVEKLRTVSDLSFPADLAAHAFGTHPAWLTWTPVIGPHGLTLLVFLIGYLLDLAWERRGDRRRAVTLAGLALALWCAPAINGWILDTTRDGNVRQVTEQTPRIGVVQPFFEPDDKLIRDRWPGLWERLIRMTAEAAQDSDLVVWPESTRPGPLIWRDGNKPRDPEMEKIADRIGVPILYGTEIAKLEQGKVRAIYNGAALVAPGRGLVDWYGKQRLLPLVEGVPFGDLIGWDPSKRDLDQKGYLTLLGNFTRGPEPTIFEVGDMRIGVLICYEGMYGALGRTYRQQGANMLVVMTNDAWWGNSTFPPWHARMVAAQARALRLPLLRAANSGVSSWTDAAGAFGERTELGKQAIMKVALNPGTAPPTFYTERGDWLAWACWLVLLGAFVRGLIAGRRS